MVIYVVQNAVSTSKGREVALQSPASLELLILTQSKKIMLYQRPPLGWF